MQHRYNVNMKNKLITTTEAGQILGLDRTQIFRLVKAGQIPAEKIGKNYYIDLNDLGIGVGTPTKHEEKQIEKSVNKVFSEYGEVIKKLGEE